MARKKISEIVAEACEIIEYLQPTNDEIKTYAELREKEKTDHGVVTYSKSCGGDGYFIHFHDTYQKKSGGHVHIDVGYVDDVYRYERNVPDTTHLMLNKDNAKDFIDFIKKKRGLTI
jgi:hypothetical protein